MNFDAGEYGFDFSELLRAESNLRSSQILLDAMQLARSGITVTPYVFSDFA
jgi:hypothetical protein